eukprot:TRINITY_DN29049_c0_g1_i2.p1 TRINITY_DN29049_c0_g1~~TRINITY_DN29049_c0_g1_i2.p1  ORF type:complete len:888 (-),score=108.73 TRINITY_DN29049_c0_g1_i2:50-2713(-)
MKPSASEPGLRQRSRTRRSSPSATRLGSSAKSTLGVSPSGKSSQPSPKSTLQASPSGTDSQSSPWVDAPWEVLCDLGWRPFDDELNEQIQEAARKREPDVRFSRTSVFDTTNTYCLTFATSEEGEQVNLQTLCVRPVRRVGAKVSTEQWAKALSHSNLEISADGRTVSSADVDDNQKYALDMTRVAYGSKLLYEGTNCIRLVYNGGNTAYLVAGLVELNERSVRDDNGKLLCSWSKTEANSTKAGFHLFSFYYKRFSVDGSPWTDFDDSHALSGEEFEPGDELLIDVNFNSVRKKRIISFSWRRKDQENELLRATVLDGFSETSSFRVCALLGGPCQSLSFADPDALPRYLPTSVAAPTKKSRALLGILSNTASRGLSLGQFLDLGKTIKDAVEKGAVKQVVDWETMNMYEVSELFVKPITKAAACSYVEFVARGSQAPQWMVSHAWSTAFARTLQMLSLHSRARYGSNPMETMYWCCTMANNQHDLSELNDEDIMRSPFARVLTAPDCVGTVLLCDWLVTPLKRVWCVFEMHLSEALRSGRLQVEKPTHFLDVAATIPNAANDAVAVMLQDALDGNWHDLAEAPGTFFPLEVARVGTQVDIAQAQASVTRDKNSILNYVVSQRASPTDPPVKHEKYDMLNLFIRSIFASAELYRLASERPNHCLESMARLLEMRADPNKFVRDGNTALFAAVGVDPKNPTPAGDDILRPMLELLLKAQADPNCVNSQALTPLDCARALPGETQDLLRKHGAQYFTEVASVHENNVNAQIYRIMRSGFTSESDAFGGSGGGGTGAKLLRGAEQALQGVAAVLKRFPTARCTIEVLATRMDRLRKRGSSVEASLRSAGCTNQMFVQSVNRGALVCIKVRFGAADDAIGMSPLLRAETV